MKLIAALLLLFTAPAFASTFPEGNAQNGKALFDKYDCSSCHKEMLGGDGSAIFTRPDHKVRSASGLIAQIKTCSGNVGAKLNTQELQHLAAYLNQYYKLK